MEATIDAVRTVDAAVPVVVGGQGVCDAEVAALVGASGWAPDGLGAGALLTALAH